MNIHVVNSLLCLAGIALCVVWIIADAVQCRRERRQWPY